MRNDARLLQTTIGSPMSALPLYERVAHRGPALDVEQQKLPSVESSPASQVAIPTPPPLPWRDDEVRRPITYRFVAPSQWSWCEGSECAGVLGRTRQVRSKSSVS